MIEAGWEWYQVFTTTASSDPPTIKYYQLALEPFVRAQANFVSKLMLKNIWYNELTFNLD